MKHLWLLLLFGLSACSISSAPAIDSIMPSSSLRNLGPAPEFVNEVWLNTDKPLHLADLRGKVVLVDMWTFG